MSRFSPNKKIEGLLNSPKEKRHKFFVHTVADNLELWGYYNEKNDAWLTEEKDGIEHIILFPEKAFAESSQIERK